MQILKAIAIVSLFVMGITSSYCQKWQTSNKNAEKQLAIVRATSLQKLDSFFSNLVKLCARQPNDQAIIQLLADHLKNNKSFLKEWEIGLNNKDAQIWHVICSLAESPYVIDSSDKAKLTCKVPFIKNDQKVPGSSGILQILPKAYLDVEHEHDVITEKPDAQSKQIGKVKSGERYAYFPGTTGYSASLRKYVPNAYQYDSEGDIGFYAIVLNAATHKLGYITTNATYLSFPLVQLQYIGGQWKIIKLDYQ